MKTWHSATAGAAALAWLGLCPLLADATPITFDFSVTATAGPLTGTKATGDFTFDSSSIVPGLKIGTLLTSLNFTWNGITYNAATANTGFLFFNSSGDLIEAFFGSDCDMAGGCGVTRGTEAWWFDSGIDQFKYTTPGFGDIGIGTATIQPRGTAPEPATLTLLGVGLAGLGLSRRRKLN